VRAGQRIGGRQAEHRLGGEPEQQFSARGMAHPASLIPSLARKVVARIEELAERNASEGSDRETRRRLHLDRDTAFGNSSSYLRPCLAIERIGRPGLAGHVGHRMANQRRDDRGDGIGVSCDLPARRQVVVARPFVADRRRGHDGVPERQLGHENARAPRGNECATSEGDELLEEAGREWCANAGMHDRETASAVLDLVDRVVADLRSKPRDLPATVFVYYTLDDVLEVAEHDMGRDIARLDHHGRLDHRLARRIELEDRRRPGDFPIAHDLAYLPGGRVSIPLAQSSVRCRADEQTVGIADVSLPTSGPS
jgi:hypothetical protein